MDDFKFEDVCHKIFTTFQSYRNVSTSSEWEDAVQEGYIQAWKDWEAGSRDFWHLVNRGRTWAKAYLQRDNGRRATGSTRRTLKGRTTAQGNITREKIRNFAEEYISVHGKRPTFRLMGEAAGVDENTAARHWRIMYQAQAASKTGTLEDVSETVMDHTRMDTSNEDEKMSQEFARAITVPDFAPSLWQDEFFWEITRNVPAKYGQALALYYGYGYKNVEIAKFFGMSRESTVNLLGRARVHARKYIEQIA